MLPLIKERMEHRTSSEKNQARFGIRTRVIWIWGQQPFLDLKLFDTNACWYSNLSLTQCSMLCNQKK